MLTIKGFKYVKADFEKSISKTWDLPGTPLASPCTYEVCLNSPTLFLLLKWEKKVQAFKSKCM